MRKLPGGVSEITLVGKIGKYAVLTELLNGKKNVVIAHDTSVIVMKFSMPETKKLIKILENAE